ncbi:hypothetical protein [uncultured Chitinophaga sp.]|uniref:hypothetical protein n=1 Tax=uncultured Chitinophaga sp. TaxID=339340 RepID=UPI0025FB1DE4|nr:hypothetical protein [uncultured Chitinophaga sp.]
MSDRKETRKKVALLLENALAELKPELGEKKFAKRIEKAAKLIAEGLEDEKAAEKPKKEKAPKPEADVTPKSEKAVKAPKAKAKAAKAKVAKVKQAVAKKKAKAAVKK